MDPLTIIRDADAARDALEWRKLEQEHAELWGQTVYNGTRRKAVACGVKYNNKAHPDSYRPDLPLSHFTDAELTRTTKQERAEYASRPLELFPFDGGSMTTRVREWHSMSGPRAIERARSRFAELSIVPSVRPSL
jgi:hypothetical protein